MQIPIRMIGLATTFFWIFLIAFFVTAVYSVKDLHFDFGEPQGNITPENQATISIPISIQNNGLCKISAFKIITEISDNEGHLITHGLTYIPVINKDEIVDTAHTMSIDINEFLEKNRNFLFNDAELRIYETVGMRIADFIPVQASANLSMPWGAPLYNFALGTVEYTMFNSTHIKALIPISFENHAFFDLVGNIQVQMYNSANISVAEGQTSLEAYRNSPYQGYIELYILTTEMPESGRFEVYLSTPFFNYGPLVMPYG